MLCKRQSGLISIKGFEVKVICIGNEVQMLNVFKGQLDNFKTNPSLFNICSDITLPLSVGFH